MFYEPQPTPYDLNFRMFGFSVRIHPFFWLLAAFFGANLGGLALVLFVLAITISVLAHELGHALAFRFFRIPSYIVLFSFGGLTIPQRGFQLRWFENAFISFAGPGAGFLIYGIFFGISRSISPDSLSVHGWEFVDYMLYFNLVWGILNLLPVFPLDGGQIMREITTFLSPRHGLIYTMKISLTAAILIIIVSVYLGHYFLALMFAWMAISNYHLLSQISYR